MIAAHFARVVALEKSCSGAQRAQRDHIAPATDGKYDVTPWRNDPSGDPVCRGGCIMMLGSALRDRENKDF
jgi:hypothetical protein